MKTINLTDDELRVLNISLDVCLKKCKSGGSPAGCGDCQTLESIVAKLN